MNPYYLEQMAKQRQREAEAEARRRRLVACYEAQHPGPVDRLRFTLGDALIRLGEHLKGRCAPPADPAVTPR